MSIMFPLRPAMQLRPFSLRAQSFRIHVRHNSSTSSTRYVPLTTSRSEAEAQYRKHHQKFWPLQKLPVSTIPPPTQVYLPYYIFSATASLTYSARLGNVTTERYYDFFRGRWRVYYRTRYWDIPTQTLSSKEYSQDVVPLHIYAGYNHPQSWLDLDSSDIMDLLSSSTYGNAGIKTEPFTRPIEGVNHQALVYLHAQEEERAKKYIQRTYDPHFITLTSSVLNAQLRSQKIYVPFWIFEFESDGKVFKTFVAGWQVKGSGETSGVKFYNHWVAGLGAGVAAALPAMMMGFSLWDGAITLSVLAVLAGRIARKRPLLQWHTAMDEIDELRRADAEAVSGRYKDSWQSSEEEPQWQRQQQGQQRQQPRPQPRPKYARNDPQGLYATLELPHTATEAQIGDSFRRLAKKYHPDMVQGGTAEKEAAKKKFQQVSTAYQVLKDPRKRREYDTFGTTSM
jgi:DnaJ domain